MKGIRVLVEVKEKGVREEGLRPREGKESEICLVNAGGEIGAAGNWQ